MYWQRRKDGRIYIFAQKDGKPQALPRSESRHLDGQEDAVINNFVNSLRPKTTAERPIMNQRLDDLVAQFLAHHRKRKMNPATLEMKRYSLLMHVFPYFLSLDPPAKDPNTWAVHSVEMLEYLEKKISPHLIARANTALRQFWKWMQEEKLVSRSIDIPLRSPVFEVVKTPLKFTVTPEEVLEFAKQAEPQMAFLALAGFFFSLRTQETLALTRRDFAAGTLANQLECCKVMKQNNLFDKFAVNITKQNSKSEKNAKAAPKRDSKGWVACFNGDAAKMLVVLIKTLGETSEDKPLIPYGVDWNLKRWKHTGITDISLKDLRRASIYWLGHYTKLGFIELKSHARHQDESTTALYLRRPEESVVEMDDLDLDA